MIKEAAPVNLRSEITENDVHNLIRWIDNKNVTLYLNESSFISERLKHLLQFYPPDMFTFCFNQEGHFYLVCDKKNTSIGFLKIHPVKKDCYEVVYVIGDECLWGNGYGKAALKKALSTLFYEIRAKEVHAKISHNNLRSKNTALHCGMKPVKKEGSMTTYAITLDEYLKKKIS